MKRRTFLQGAAALATASPIMLGRLSARAASPLPLLGQLGGINNDKILVVIQLFGGNDGLNTIIPVDDAQYYKIRPDIGIAKSDAYSAGGGVYMNPGLATGDKGGYGQMFSYGTLAIVRGIGYDHPNLSHFRSTDIWLSGINSSDPSVSLNTGWLGRFLENRFPDFPASLPDDPLAIQFGGFSLALVSEKGRMGIEVGNPSLQAGFTSQTDALDADSTGTNYALENAFVADIAARSNKYAQRVTSAYAAGKAKLQGHYASDALSQQLASVAALIAGGLQTKVYIVGMGGFDTHVTQQTSATQGSHPTLLGRLGDSCAQFVSDLQHLDTPGAKISDRVVGMTISEFGRRPYQNGSLGTDHGAASVQFVFGTQVNGEVYGDSANLSDLDPNGDLKPNYDFRQVYADVLTTWFGMSLVEARTVLKDDLLTPLPIIKTQPDAVPRTDPSQVGTGFINYPNPFGASTTFEISLPQTADVFLEVVNLKGMRIAEVINRRMASGSYRIPFSPQALASGSYMAILRAGSDQISRVIWCTK